MVGYAKLAGTINPVAGESRVVLCADQVAAEVSVSPMVERHWNVIRLQGSGTEPLAQVFQHDARDVRQLQGTRLHDGMPLEVGKLAVLDRHAVRDGLGGHAEEARVEAARPPRRRDGARKKFEL